MKKIISSLAAIAMTAALTVSAAAYDLPEYKESTKTIGTEKYVVSELQLRMVDGKAYTGFTKTKSGARYYYIEGIKQGGVVDVGNKRYIFEPTTGKSLGYRTLDKKNSVVLKTPSADVQIDDIETAKLEYSIVMNGFSEKQAEDYTFGESFTLYKYENGKWNELPMKDDWGFNDLGYIATGDIPTVNISGFFKMFDYKFTSGIYRVETTYHTGSGGYAPQGTLKTYTAWGEFNLYVSPEAYNSQTRTPEQIEKMYTLETEKPSYSLDFETIKATLTNVDAGSVGCGYPFSLEKHVGGEWKSVDINAAFIMPYITLTKGGAFDGYVLRSTMLKEKPTAGTYRIVTHISVEGDSVKAAAEFTLV